MATPETAANAFHALGAELAAYRRAAGHTQASFARLVAFSRSSVANVETGRQLVPRRFWEHADQILRTGGVLAIGYDDAQAIAVRERRAVARQASSLRLSAQRELSSGRDRAPADRASHQQVAEVPAGRCDPVQPVPAGDLARLSGMRQHLRAIDNGHGGQAALPMTEWYLQHEVLPMLKGAATDDARVVLAVIAAEFQHDAGWSAYDAGLPERAKQHFLAALRLAREAGDRLLSARILAAMSHQAISLDQRARAIDFAQAARRLARRVATPRTAVMLATMEACAHAAAGDRAQCQQALDDATTALTMIGNGGPDPDWLDFDEGGYWGHAARAYRDLGQGQRAEECAATSVGLCQPGHTRTRAQRLTIQATARLQQGDADAAAAAGELIVRDAWTLHSSHVFGEVKQLADALAAYRTPVAADFLTQAHDLLVHRQQESAPQV